MGIFTKGLFFLTKKALEFVDITAEVQKATSESHIENGLVLIYAKHTTAAIKINEYEAGLLEDFKDFLKKIVPSEIYYRHNDFRIRVFKPGEDESECPNGHSHCQHLLLGASETVPLIKGKLALGRWQRIFLVELCEPRKREVCVQIVGK